MAAAAVSAVGCGESSEEKAAVRQAACKEHIGEFVEALQDLDGRLDVGLTYPDYGTKVGDIAAEHAQIDVSEIDDRECLEVAATGEVALGSYRKASELWTRCIRERDSPGCRTSDAISSKLQPHWRAASGKVEQMQSDLTTLGEG